MTFDRKDYTDHVGQKRRKQLNGRRGTLEVMQQQAVRAELLTGDEHWDTFLSYIQTAIDHSEAQAASYRAALESPDMVDPNEIMATKFSLIAENNKIAAWNAVLSLPKDLKEQGDAAETLLSKLDG